MVFKRRDPKGWLAWLRDLLWPRGGWSRAAQYVHYRLRRLPDRPERIARGIAAGVFTAFTPFYGLHFICAALIATILRGNILAALMATFFGNPLTYVPIGLICLKSGHFLLGNEFTEASERSFAGKFTDAGYDLWHNFVAIFTDRVADWHGLSIFYHDVFFPYLVGGIAPGILSAAVCYYLSVPVIRAYQARRRGSLKSRMRTLRSGVPHGRRDPAE